MSGWHDRLKAEVRTCLAKQVTESDKRLPKAGLNHGLTCQSLDSPLFGKGRVNASSMWHYDLQSRLFDHLIHAWSWTGDLALEKMLRLAMGKLSHEPGKTGATRANLRPLGQWPREIVPVCSDATPSHLGS